MINISTTSSKINTSQPIFKNRSIAIHQEQLNFNTNNDSGLFLKTYFDTSSVDTRPAPIDNWSIEKDKLVKIQGSGETIRFTIWVSEYGNIDRLEFLDIQNIPEPIKLALAEIANTQMAPATIRNIPVPCVMTLELNFGY